MQAFRYILKRDLADVLDHYVSIHTEGACHTLHATLFAMECLLLVFIRTKLLVSPKEDE